MMRGRQLAENGLWSLGSHVLWRGSMVVAAIVLARVLSTSDFAAFAYFQLTTTLLATYAALGLGTTASRFFAEVGYERPDAESAPLGSLLAVSGILSLIVALGVLVIPSEVITAGLDVPKWLLALGAGIISLGVVPGGAIVGVEKFKEASFISALSGAVMVGGSWWAGTAGNPKLAMIALIVGSAVQVVGQTLVVSLEIGWSRVFAGFGLRPGGIRRVYAYAGPLMLVSAMTGSGAWIVGRMILGASGEEDFALYSIGMQWFALAVLLPNMFSRVLFPRMVREAGLGTHHAKRTLRQATYLASISGMIVAAIGVGAGPVVSAAYGEAYTAGRWMLGAFMVAGLLNAPISTMGNALLALDRQRVWASVTACWFLVLLLSAGVSVCLDLGAWSGATAQAVANGVQLAATLVVCSREGLL